MLGYFAAQIAAVADCFYLRDCEYVAADDHDPDYYYSYPSARGRGGVYHRYLRAV